MDNEITLEDLGMQILNVPEELQKSMKWAVSTYDLLDPKTGRRDKSPRNAHNGERISVVSEEGWCSFEEAINSGYPYIGCRLTAEDPYVVIDLDDSEVQERKDEANKIISTFSDTYTEISASGKGIHILLKGPTEKGLRRNNIEVYSQERYIIFTGRVGKRGQREIKQGGSALADLRSSLNPMVNPDKMPPITNSPEVESDNTIVKKMLGAKNFKQIKELFTYEPKSGDDWSQLDAKLAQHIAFYTRNQEQALRLFKRSKLYRGDSGNKAGYERKDKYDQIYLLNMTFGRAWRLEDQRRSAQLKLEQEEVDKLVAKHKVEHTIKKSKKDVEFTGFGKLSIENYEQWLEAGKLPPMSPMTGLLGRISDFIYDDAPLPVRTIANAGALALVSGIAGRHYNINGSGLTLFLVLLAGTGRGKEAASSGAKKVLESAMDAMPRSAEFLGPSHIASGQGLIRNLAENGIPSKTVYLSEFGHTLKIITDNDANSADIKTRQVLLDLFSKSAWGSVINEMSYADKAKNTAIIQSPNLCILGDTTPDTFFSTVKTKHIKEGFLPRFMLIEHEGERGELTMKPYLPVPDDLSSQLITLISQVCSLHDDHIMIDIVTDGPESTVLLDEFQRYCSSRINSDERSEYQELWNRAHLKALRLAGLFALSDNIFLPKVTVQHAQLAIEYVLRDMLSYSIRMETGQFGAGELERTSKIKKVLFEFFEGKMEVSERNRRYLDAGVIPLAFITRMLATNPIFSEVKRGAKQEIINIIGYLVKEGVLTEVRSPIIFGEDNAANLRNESAFMIGPHYYDEMETMKLRPEKDVYMDLFKEKEKEDV